MNVLTCFLLMTGDLTGLMGETDSLVAGETGLQQHRIKIQSNFMHHPVLKSKPTSKWGRTLHNTRYFFDLRISFLTSYFMSHHPITLTSGNLDTMLVIPDGCGRRPFHMSDRWRRLLASSCHLGNEGGRGFGGRLWGNARRGFVGQMLSHHSSFHVHLHHGGGLETGFHLLKGKRYIASSILHWL